MSTLDLILLTSDSRLVAPVIADLILLTSVSRLVAPAIADSLQKQLSIKEKGKCSEEQLLMRELQGVH